MNADQLKALQAPLKTRYRDDPASALIQVHARGTLDAQGVACNLDTGRQLAGKLAQAGLHPAAGGDGSQLCSGDMLLEALVACAGVTLKAVATALGVEVRGGEVSAEGDLDFRGTLGVDKAAPVGLQAIRLRFALDTDAPDDALQTLHKLTERYCVVLQTLKPALPITTQFVRSQAARD